MSAPDVIPLPVLIPAALALWGWLGAVVVRSIRSTR